MRLAVCLLILCTATSTLAADGFVPAWSKGQTWLVESRSTVLSLHGDRPEAGDHFAPPIVWEYQVANVKDAGPLRYYQILVGDSKKQDPRRAGLIFIAELGEGGKPVSLALAKATFESPLRGKAKRQTRDYRAQAPAPHAIISEESLVPADFPFFSAKSMAPGAVTTFEITEMSGGLPFARDTVQSVKKEAPAKFPFRGPDEPIRPKAGGDRSRDLHVVIERPTDGARVHQIWNPDLPWAVYARSHRGVSYLLPPASNR